MTKDLCCDKINVILKTIIKKRGDILGKNKKQSVKRRNTRQRSLILCCLSGGKNCNLEDHIHNDSAETIPESLTADEIEARLSADGEKVGKATIYRFLHQLLEENTVRRYITGNGSACYQYILDSNDFRNINMVCQYCGKILYVDSDEILKKTTVVGEKYGFEIDCNKTVFYGTCNDCSKAHGNVEDYHVS